MVTKHKRQTFRNLADLAPSGAEAPAALGKSDEWLREQLADASKPDSRDFFNQWTTGNQSSPITPEQLAEIAAMPTDPDYNANETVAKIKEATSILKQSDELELTPDEAAAYLQADEVDVAGALHKQAEDLTNDIAMEQATDTGDKEFDYAGYRITESIPESWTDDDIDQWIAAAGYTKGHTEFGVIVVDPTRKRRPIATWGIDEIQAAFAGELPDVDESQHGDLAKAYRSQESVEPAWSLRELIDWLVQGLEPAKTTNGAWRNDVTRARRLAQDWSTQELIAWANGEIRAAGETTDAKVASELNKRLDLGVNTNSPTDVIRVYKKTLSNSVQVIGEQPTAPTSTTLQPEQPQSVAIPLGLTKMNVAYLKTQTERYLAACKPGVPITPEKGIKEQRQLDNLFRYILKLDDPAGFGAALTYLRDFYAANRLGLFEPTYALRFTGGLRAEGYLQETHVNLLTILQAYTNPDKASRKQIDLAYLLRNFPIDRQAWLIEFFQKYC